jgi:hypothetical protein
VRSIKNSDLDPNLAKYLISLKVFPAVKLRIDKTQVLGLLRG